ncbi:MAG: DNA polymerase III subunit delta [Endomicrobium sp.]|jgi:DNA polymerase-3 subunit delta|nr:DNA polymerase III subunit delta [Endomicrobium sp.]
MSSNEISPIYLFAGDEHYFLDKCLNKIENLFVVDDFNKEVFYSLESSTKDILSSLQTFHFMNKRKVVVIKDLDKIKSSDAEKLIGYLSNIIESSCLVLLYFGNYKKDMIAKRKELVNKCISSKYCTFVDCMKLHYRETIEFIKNKFILEKKVISDDVILKIIEQNGTDLLNILSEIEKFLLFIGKNEKNVTIKTFEKIKGYTKEINIHTLSFLIEEKNLKKSIFVLEKLLNEGEEAIAILYVIFFTIRKMLVAKSLLEEQLMSISEIALTLKIHNFYIENFFINLKKHNMCTLRVGLKKILEADINIKTNNGCAILALEKIVFYICKSDK